MQDLRIIFFLEKSTSVRIRCSPNGKFFIYQVPGIEAADKVEREQTVELLLVNFPVIQVTRNCSKVQDVLIDTKRLMFDPECFAMLFQADDEPNQSKDAHPKGCQVPDQSPKPVKEGPKCRLGCQPLWLDTLALWKQHLTSSNNTPFQHIIEDAKVQEREQE